jgi:hypothetical protein
MITTETTSDEAVVMCCFIKLFDSWLSRAYSIVSKTLSDGSTAGIK